MNIFQKIYCRGFQAAFKLALPILPYKNPKIIGKIEEIPSVLRDNGKKSPLIVTDKTIRSLGLTEKLEGSLKDQGMNYALFDGVIANPTTDNVNEALTLYDTSGCDSLVAFGGGSPIDCAKGVGALVARRKKTLNDLRGILKVRRKIPLLIAVPTTAGTGSETTLACVIVDGKTRHKYAINDFPLIPSYAVLDEETTTSLPPDVVSTTGMDALTHAIEAYIGRSGNASTRRDALEAIKLVFENLEVSYKEKTAESRRNMLIASHKAGRAFSKAYVGYVHALAHALGGKYDVPHGLANAVVLPIVLREYGDAIDKKLYEIAVYCSLAEEGDSYEEAARKTIDRIQSMNDGFSIPRTMPIIKEKDIPEMADYAYREANPLYPVPVLWDREKLEETYRKIRG